MIAVNGAVLDGDPDALADALRMAEGDGEKATCSLLVERERQSDRILQATLGMHTLGR